MPEKKGRKRRKSTGKGGGGGPRRQTEKRQVMQALLYGQTQARGQKTLYPRRCLLAGAPVARPMAAQAQKRPRKRPRIKPRTENTPQEIQKERKRRQRKNRGTPDKNRRCSEFPYIYIYISDYFWADAIRAFLSHVHPASTEQIFFFLSFVPSLSRDVSSEERAMGTTIIVCSSLLVSSE